MQRTIVYVDGFNLYYGCLKKTPYRWLDLKSLFSKLLDHSHEIFKIKYFTALVADRQDDTRSRLHQICEYADFIKPIRHTVLINSQLPSNIPNSIITKPINW